MRHRGGFWRAGRAPGQPVAVGVLASGPSVRVDGAHRLSSLNRLNTVRSANVAMMIVPMTTTTPAAEARP